MATRPNITDIESDGTDITLRGESDPEPPGDIIHIHLMLTQGEQTTGGDASPLGADWQARVPADGFQAGPATATGVEVRKANATTTTWTETIEIP